MSQGFLRITDVQIWQEYQIGLSSGNPSSAQLINFPPTNLSSDNRNISIIAVLEARGDNIVFKFGGSTVAASATVSSNALAQGNFSIAEGAIFSVTINSQTQNYVSAVGETSGSSTAIVRIGVLTL